MPVFAKDNENEFRNFIIIAVALGSLTVIALMFLLSSGDLLIFHYIGAILKNLWWVIFPIPLWYIFLTAWNEYTEFMFVIKQEYLLLEIRPPSDTERSPRIMEQVFAGLHTFSSINKFEQHCGWRPLQEKFTFEIASVEGVVHFYVRCRGNSRDLVESLIYAQYPDAEIFEAEDYTKQVPKILPNKNWNVWGTALRLEKEDPVPLRTYRAFKEDVTGHMIDPLASLTEVMGSLKKNEHLWVQFVFTPQAEKDWKASGKAKIDEITGQAEKANANPLERIQMELADIFVNAFRAITGQEVEFSTTAKKEEKQFNINELTPGTQEILRAIEDNIAKESFMVAGRIVYAAERTIFNKARGVAGAMGTMKQFADINLNSLIPDNRTKTYALYYFTEARLAYRQRKIIQDYRDRAFAGATFHLSIEELATIYHFPDMSIKSPTIQRIEAKKGEAPFNLPISPPAAS